MFSKNINKYSFLTLKIINNGKNKITATKYVILIYKSEAVNIEHKIIGSVFKCFLKM